MFKFFIPLNEIFPQLKEFPDDLIYLGLGQQLKMNIRLNPGTDFITKLAPYGLNVGRLAGDANYSIR